jgi:hypothetical protein
VEEGIVSLGVEHSGVFGFRPVIGAESRPVLKVSFNLPRPRSQPALAAGRVCQCWMFIFAPV